MAQREMLLELFVLSYHRLSPRQVSQKRFGTSGGTLGRFELADWYLPDPERVVSGVHALISYQNEQFIITDMSTNGLFVNREVDALGQGNSRVLRHSDIICLGDYEIQIALIDAPSTSVVQQSPQITSLSVEKSTSAPATNITPLHKSSLKVTEQLVLRA